MKLFNKVSILFASLALVMGAGLVGSNDAKEVKAESKETLIIDGVNNKGPWGTSYNTSLKNGVLKTSNNTSVNLSYLNVGTMSSCIQIAKKTSNCFYSTSFPKNTFISSIQISMNKNDCYVYMSTDGSKWTTATTVSSSQTLSYSLDNGYKFFKIGATSSFCQISSVTITYEPSGTLVESMQITKDGNVIDTLHLVENEMYSDFIVTIKPDDATNKEVEWTSENSDVAEYDSDDSGNHILAYSAGQTTITATAKDGSGCSASIIVYVVAEGTPILKSVEVSGELTKKTQYVGQKFDSTGLTFTPVYDKDNSEPETITAEDITWPSLTAGMTSITGKYKGIYVVVEGLIVEEDAISSLTVSGSMKKISYYAGEEWDYTGLVVEANYKSGKEPIDVTNEVTWTADKSPADYVVGENQEIKIAASLGAVSTTAIVKVNVIEAPSYATFNFDNTSMSTLLDSPITINGIKVTAKGTTNNYFPVRLYKGGSISFSISEESTSIESINKIEITFTESKYGSNNLDSTVITPESSVNNSNEEFIIKPLSKTNIVTISASNGQLRIVSVIVHFSYKDTTEKFISDWQALRTAAGNEGICHYLSSANRAELDAMLERYEAFSDADKAIIDAAKDGDTTIGNTIAYVTNVIAGTQPTDKDYTNSGVIITSNYSIDSTSLIALFALLGIGAISAYYFIEKKKLSK